MRKLASGLLLLTIAAAMTAQTPDGLPGIRFHSSDSTLAATFRWAAAMARSYVHTGGDTVGPWYVAALPGREAFCMRDMAHQSIGAHLLGLERHNMNMAGKFVTAIADSRDWCGFWEINRHNRPVPVDYRSDKEFWHNLPANHDLISSLWKLYNWTADVRYISAPEFTRYYNICTGEFIERWNLSPDSIMSRPQFMNRSPEVRRGTPYYACRGIPSYVEGLRGLSSGIDLIGALYNGCLSVAKIGRLNKNISSRAPQLRRQADAYRSLIETRWWDDKDARYHAFHSQDGTFAHGEGLIYTLCTGIIHEGPRRDACVKAVLEREWNIENMSHLPALLLDLGYPAEAYRLIGSLPSKPRNDYPELSFALIEALVRAGMGITPDAEKRSLTTEYRFTNTDATVTAADIPLFGGTITLHHDSTRSSTLTNNTGKTIRWTPVFDGRPAKTIKIKPGGTRTACNR